MRAHAGGLAAAAVVLVATALACAWVGAERLTAMNVGPQSGEQQDIDAWIRAQQQAVVLAEMGGPILAAGLFAAVGAVVILAVRAQRASASATASRDAS